MLSRFIPVIARISSSISVDCQTRNSMWLSQLSIHPVMEIWVVSTLQLWIMLLWTLIYMFLFGRVLFPCGGILSSELAGWFLLFLPFLRLSFLALQFLFLLSSPPFVQTCCPVSPSPELSWLSSSYGASSLQPCHPVCEEQFSPSFHIIVIFFMRENLV